MTALAVTLLVVGCSTSDSTASDTASAAVLAAGEASFVANCAVCHGSEAQGTEQGPPLIDDVYRPGHHADGSFLVAVLRGVPQHHWRFGPMESIDGVSDQEVATIVAYVRELQQAQGIE